MWILAAVLWVGIIVGTPVALFVAAIINTIEEEKNGRK
jgi:hypothetical protein